MKALHSDNTSQPINLFLLLECRLLREALSGILRKQTDICIVGGDHYSPSVVHALLESNCHVLLSDQLTAQGLPPDFLENVTATHPRAKVVLVGMEDDFDIFLQAIRSGASGFLLENAGTDDTLDAIRKVARDEAVCPAHLCLQLFHFVARIAGEGSFIVNQRLCNRLGLTGRQQQLVALLAKGLTNKEIAVSLNLSEFTVRNHVHRIMQQLNVKSRQAAVETVCHGSLAAPLQPERHAARQTALVRSTTLGIECVRSESRFGSI